MTFIIMAQFLDPRTVWCIEDADELKLVIGALNLLANLQDIALPSRISSQQAVSLAAASSSRFEKEANLYTNYMIMLVKEK